MYLDAIKTINFYYSKKALHPVSSFSSSNRWEAGYSVLIMIGLYALVGLFGCENVCGVFDQ